MSLSFKDYVVIVDALEADRLEEGWMDDAILAVKKKLGSKMTDDQIKAEIAKIKEKDVKKIGSSPQSKDFYARREAQQAKAKATQAKAPQGTVGTQGSSRSQGHSERAGQARYGEHAWAMAEDLNEGQIEFNVEYVAKGGGTTKKTVIKGIDVTAVKEKFRRQYAGWKFLTAKPKPVKKA